MVNLGLGSEATVEESSAEIDRFVRSCRLSLAYHRSDFLDVVSEELGAQVHWISVREQGEIVAVIPFLEKDGPFGKIVNSLAFYGSNGAVVQRELDENLTRKALAAFKTYCREGNVSSATVITNPLFGSDELYSAELNWDMKDFRYSYVTNLEKGRSFDDFIERFEDPRPRNIRRAQKEGVTVVQDNSAEAISRLAFLHKANMAAIGGSFKTEEFLHALVGRMAPEAWTVYVAHLRGEVVAALLLLLHADTVEYFIPAIDPSYRATQASALVNASAMHNLGGLGYRYWNWGGTWEDQSGVRDYKKKWDCLEKKYHYFSMIFDPELLEVDVTTLQAHYRGFFVYPFPRDVR